MPLFTYSSAEVSDLHKVRGLIGDVTETDPRHIFDDDELLGILSAHPDTLSAAIEGVDRILARRAPNADRSGAGINTQRATVFQQYKELREILVSKRSESQAALCTGTATGLSSAEVHSVEANSDFILPFFGDEPRRTRGGLDDGS